MAQDIYFVDEEMFKFPKLTIIYKSLENFITHIENIREVQYYLKNQIIKKNLQLKMMYFYQVVL
jgi:hypothetical protein